jgi:hypothetical protein
MNAVAWDLQFFLQHLFLAIEGHKVQVIGPKKTYSNIQEAIRAKGTSSKGVDSSFYLQLRM